MAVLSVPDYTTIPTTCIKYVHPWTDSCRDATLGLLLHAFQHSLKTYTTVYLFTLIMRRKKLSRKVILQTVLGILQSTVFLTTHAYGFSTAVCTLRWLTGRFDKYSVSFTPAFLSSLVAMQLERPSRHPILCLYVTNVATETLFRMAVWRGWVKPIRYGQVLIFTISTAALMYMYRSKKSDDSMFSLIRYVVGADEEAEGALDETTSPSRTPPPSPRRPRGPSHSSLYSAIMKSLRMYRRLVGLIKAHSRSVCCRHPHSCIYYSLAGGVKMMAVGYGVQVVLRMVLSAQKILRRPSMLAKTLVSNKVLNLGAFLALFSSVFRGTSCALRWWRGEDSPVHAIPAGLLAGLSFWFYPDNTAALYVMWKALQVMYCDLVADGILPDIPHGTILLYSFSTAVLFHAALLEPHNLRSSYFRFLYGLSGGRIATMDRGPLDAFLLNTSTHLAKVITDLKLNPNPRYRFRIWGNPYPNILV